MLKPVLFTDLNSEENISYHVIEFSVEEAFFRRLLDEGLIVPDSLQNAVLKRKVEFLSGRYCAKNVLQKNWNFNGEQLGIGPNREPLFPDHILGSISHSLSTAICVTACAKKHNAIGVDLEEILNKKSMKEIEGQVFCSQEKKMIGNDLLLATAVFSLKEAYFKAIGPKLGKFFGFEAIEVLGIDLDANEIIFKELLAPSLPYIRPKVEQRAKLLRHNDHIGSLYLC